MGTSEPQTPAVQTDADAPENRTETETGSETLRPSDDSTWPMRRHDSGLTGFTPEYGPVAELSVDWKWPENTNHFQPIFDESQFYVTAGAVRGVSTDGETQWENQISGKMPVVVGDTLVMSHERRMFAWDTKTGQRQWFTDPILRGYTGPLQARNGLVYATVDTGDGVGVTAFELNTGARAWSITHEGLPVRYPLLPAITTDRFYLPRGTPEIQVHDSSSGKHVETLDVGGSLHDVVVANENVKGDGTLYALSRSEQDGDFVAAVDPSTGETLWNEQLSFDHSQYATLPTLTVDYESVYVPATTGLVVLDRDTGERQWEADVAGRFDETIVAAGNAIYVVTHRRRLHVFDYRTGDELASHSFEDPIYGLAVSDGRVFVSTNQVHAISGETVL